MKKDTKQKIKEIREKYKSIQRHSYIESIQDKLHNSIAHKIIEGLLVHAYSTEQQTCKEINHIFNKLTISDWHEILLSLPTHNRVARVLEKPELQQTLSFYIHTLSTVEKKYKLTVNSDSNENFFHKHVNLI